MLFSLHWAPQCHDSKTVMLVTWSSLWTSHPAGTNIFTRRYIVLSLTEQQNMREESLMFPIYDSECECKYDRAIPSLISIILPIRKVASNISEQNIKVLKS